MVDGVDIGSVVGGGAELYGPLGIEALSGEHLGGLAHPNWRPGDTFEPGDDATGVHGIVALLNCSCGILDCGGLFTHVSRNRDVVLWDFFWRGLGEVVVSEAIVFDARHYFDVIMQRRLGG
jgi:hypothetical protein